MRLAQLYVLIVLIWGTSWFAITFQLEGTTATQSLFYRFSSAAMLMLAYALFKRRPLRWPLRVHGYFALQGLSLFCLNYYLFYLATFYIPSGFVALGFATLPIVTTANLFLFLKQKPNTFVLWGSIVGLLGLLLVLSPSLFGAQSQEVGEGFLFGILICLLATFFSSWGNILANSLKKRDIPLVPSMTWGLIYGVIFLFLFVLWDNFSKGVSWQLPLTAPYLLSLFYLSAFGSVIGFLTYLHLLRVIGPDRVAYTTVLFPVVALILSSFFEDFHWHPLHFVGIFFVLVGNVIIFSKAKRPLLKKGL